MAGPRRIATIPYTTWFAMTPDQRWWFCEQAKQEEIVLILPEAAYPEPENVYAQFEDWSKPNEPL